MFDLWSLLAIVFFAVLASLLWSYGLKILVKVIKLVVVGVIKVIYLTLCLLFRRKKKAADITAEVDRKEKETVK